MTQGANMNTPDNQAAQTGMLIRPNFNPGADAVYRLEDHIKFGAQMRERRESRRLTLNQMGQVAGMPSGSNLGKIERGTQCNVSGPMAERLIRICAYLQLPPPRFTQIRWSEVVRETHQRIAAQKAAEQEQRREERRLARLARQQQQQQQPAPKKPAQPAPAPAPSRDQLALTMIKLITTGQVEPNTGLEILRLALLTTEGKR